jgi:hypothetical protein
MKTNLCSSWLAGGLALALPWINGCAQEAASAPGAVGTNALAAAVATNLPAPAEVVATNFPVPPDPTEAARPLVPDPAAAEARPLPAGLYGSPSFMEVVRMANAGVESGLMMSFVTNSAGTFNLGADQIIYLKDIGVSHEVIAKMIEHDLAISTGSFQVTASTVPPRSSAAPATAAASTTPPVTTAPMQASTWQAPAPDTNAAANAYAPAFNGSAPPPTGQSPETAPAAPQPTTVVNNNYFYDTLSPYGNWVNVEGYGNVWQPNVTVINTAWRPYLDGGRWLYTDAGWYWSSDYAWGCTFQYGRWFYQPTYGWCWWPNTVWGPAWVTWRSASGYCGWAPLPPYSGWTVGVGFTWYDSAVSVGFGFNYGCGYYNWVPYSGVCSATPYRHCVPHAKARGIYKDSTVINNVIIGDNNTIINRGIDADHVTRQAGRQVPRATIRDVASVPGQGVRGDRVRREAGNVVVERSAESVARGPVASGRFGASGPNAAPASQRTSAGPVRPSSGAVRSVSTRGAGGGNQLAPAGNQTEIASRTATPTTTRGTEVARINPTQTAAPTGTRVSEVSAPVRTPAARSATVRGDSSTAAVGTDPRRVTPAPSYSPAATRPQTAVTRPTTFAPATQASPRTSYTAPASTATRSYAPAPTQPAPVARPNYTSPSAPVARPSVAAPSTQVARPTYTAPGATRSSFTAPSAALANPSYSAPSAPVMRSATPAPSAPVTAMRPAPAPAPAPMPASRPTTSSEGSGRPSRSGNGR